MYDNPTIKNNNNNVLTFMLLYNFYKLEEVRGTFRGKLEELEELFFLLCSYWT